MNKLLSIMVLATMATSASAQQSVLTLDSCRQMALGNNKTLTASKVQRTMAEQTRKAARTKYLPHLDVVGGAIFSSKEISILNNTQKSTLKNIGTNIGGMLGISDPKVTGTLDKIGQDVTDAFRTNNRQMYMVSAMVTQPVYMGGAITAANRIAEISETMAANKEEASRQTILHDIDQTYWTVISLRHKQKLADSYLTLVKKLDSECR